MYEFGRGDRVRVIGGIYEGSVGTIVENNIQEDDEFSPYGVLLDGERHIRLFYNHCLEPENLLDCKIDESDDFDESETISNIYNEREPKFQIGDVVESTQDVSQSLSNPLYVIKEAITLVDNDLPVGYSYEVAPINSPDGSIIINEDALLFQYHDSNWNEYFTEGTRQRILPAWRGELYNLYACYIDIDTHGAFDRATINEYKDHTIPPLRMKHILSSHSIYDRIWDVVMNHGNARYSNNRDQIKNKFKIDDLELDRIVDSIRRKINARNKNDLNPKNMKTASKAHPDFTDEEYQLIYEIDRLDISGGMIKDHFPVNMTNLQIMDAIKEVYMSKELKRIDGRQICKNKKEGSEEDLDAPQLGKIHYQGYSYKHDLTIQFLYNFDYDFIETAYPVSLL